MRISTKGRYALLMLIDLAEHQDCGFVALKDIAHRQNISKKYLEQIIPILNKGNILRTTRGSQGGYMLAKPPAKYTVGDILRLTEASLSSTSVLETDPNSYDSGGECITTAIWQGLNKVINEYLDGITLQDILDQQREMYANNYII